MKRCNNSGDALVQLPASDSKHLRVGFHSWGSLGRGERAVTSAILRSKCPGLCQSIQAGG